MLIIFLLALWVCCAGPAFYARVRGRWVEEMPQPYAWRVHYEEVEEQQLWDDIVVRLREPE